jgi:subtilisin family serine protease
MTSRLSGTALAALTASLLATATPHPSQPEAPAIRLGAAAFRPAAGETPPAGASMMIGDYAPGQRGYYVVQAPAPITEAWKSALTAEGVELLDYVPDFAFKVRMSPAQAGRVSQLTGVAWVGLFHPAYKLAPDLARDGARGYVVTIERGADVTAAAAAVAGAGARIMSREGRVLTVFADSARLAAIARVLDVATIENFHVPVKHNEYGGGVILGASTAHAAGYAGNGQIIAVADTGLGDGTPTGAHPHLAAGRIAAIRNWPGTGGGLCFETIVDDGARDVDTGHGTHTALSAVGGGGPSGEGAGTAPGARLAFQAVENWVVTSAFCKLFLGLNDGYYLIGLPADLGLLYGQAYADGARVHSNSWGLGAGGAYTTEAVGSDTFVWNNRDMVITFSAGNAGTDANGDGVVDAGSISPPSTAKNVISVGASENDRQSRWDCDPTLTYTPCASQGGQNVIGSYFAMFGGAFATNPLRDDPSAGNAGQMAAFSSRGPASDGRIKPDLVAPGTWVVSGYADPFQREYDASPNPQNGAWQYDGWGHPYSDAYKYLGGTSMSNPLVAGAAAVVRDYYGQTAGHAPSAALVKATLINSAVDLLDENNDGVDDNAYPIPNHHEGWGRVDVAAAVDGSRVFQDEAAGLATGASATSTYAVTAAGGPFKATLVWSDYPGTANALPALVNDLDLVVTAPDGTEYRGNVFSGGWSYPGGTADRTNNVENVYVADATSGTWTVQVRGFNVPSGPQPFALVVQAALGDIEPPPPPAPPAAPSNLVAVAMSTNQVDLAWSDNSSDESGFHIERCEGSQCTAFALVAQTASDVSAFSDVTVAAGTTYGYRVRAVNEAGGSGYTNTASVTTTDPPPPPPPASVHIGDLDGEPTSVGKGYWAATVRITVHDQNHVVVSDATVTGSWSDGTTAACATTGDGQCVITAPPIHNSSKSTTFTVTGIAHATLTYSLSLNHDPDGDSSGTSIVIRR